MPSLLDSQHVDNLEPIAYSCLFRMRVAPVVEYNTTIKGTGCPIPTTSRRQNAVQPGGQFSAFIDRPFRISDTSVTIMPHNSRGLTGHRDLPCRKVPLNWARLHLPAPEIALTADQISQSRNFGLLSRLNQATDISQSQLPVLS